MKLRFWEKFKAYWATTLATRQKHFFPSQLSWKARCVYYDNIVETHPLAKAALFTIAGQGMAEGVFTQAPTVEEPHEGRVEEAKEEIDNLNGDIGLDTMLYETMMIMAKYGSCFWELTREPTFDVRVLPNLELLEPMEQDEIGNILRWRQQTWIKPTPEFSSSELVHFAWNITAKSWPYGTSLLIGCAEEFDILEQLETDIKNHMHRVAFPETLIGVGDEKFQPTAGDINTVKKDVANWKPGEKHVTSYPVSQVVVGGGQKTIADLDSVLGFVKDNISDAMMVPTINKLYNSTFASSKEMTTWTLANLIRPMQRIIARKIENELYKPYLEDTGYSVKTCPRLRFEPPDKNKVEEATYYTQLVGSGILTPEIAAEELGYGDRLEEMQQQKLERQERQMELMKQKTQAFGQPKPDEKEEANAKVFAERS